MAVNNDIVPGPRQAGGQGRPAARRRSWIVWVVALCLLLAGGVWFFRSKAASGEGAKSGARGEMPPAPVSVSAASEKELPIYLEGIGTVQAFNTVTVRSRVDGQVQKVAFVEGQEVKAGDLLAQIDPAPFEAQLAQNQAKKAQDEAQLAVARVTLTRDKQLLADKILAQQDYDTQQALVKQLQAAVQADQAAIDSTKVQLGYTTITSPLDGRTGMRLVDPGNIVHANDATGLVVVTQLRPISVLFTLPEQDLRQVREHLTNTQGLVAYALDRDNHTRLSEGKLAVVDNQIDTTTGTLRLKATFPNTDMKLWPGQFVNVQLLLEKRKGVVVPASVVQRGPEGTFAYVVTPEQTAAVKPVAVARIEQGQALIESGLVVGEQVVVDGQYKLRPGAKVKIAEAQPPHLPSQGQGTSIGPNGGQDKGFKAAPKAP